MDGEDVGRLHERTWLDSARDIVVDLGGWLARLDWLTTAAWVLTLGCLGCAILDSYTSLCVVGGTLGHIGDKSACWEFGGWDTRVFPLAVDMGWGGALFAVLRLASAIGMKSWRWWVVLAFEALTAAFTIAGNAFHGAVVSNALGDIGAWTLVLTCVASAVPGVTAVGSGFTLSVLVSTRMARHQQDTPPVRDRGEDDETSPGPDEEPVTERNPHRPRLPARAQVRRLLQRHGADLDPATVAARTGVSQRHAARLLREERQPDESTPPQPKE